MLKHVETVASASILKATAMPFAHVCFAETTWNNYTIASLGTPKRATSNSSRFTTKRKRSRQWPEFLNYNKLAWTMTSEPSEPAASAKLLQPLDLFCGRCERHILAKSSLLGSVDGFDWAMVPSDGSDQGVHYYTHQQTMILWSYIESYAHCIWRSTSHCTVKSVWNPCEIHEFAPAPGFEQVQGLYRCRRVETSNDLETYHTGLS